MTEKQSQKDSFVRAKGGSSVSAEAAGGGGSNWDGWLDLMRGGRGIYTLLINLGISLHAMDIFVIATVMPVVVGDIGGVEFYTWTTMLYMTGTVVGSASSASVRGYLGWRYGYVIGGLIFLAGMIGCAASPTMATLLVARSLQGIGGGLIISQSMAFLREHFDGPLRPRALSVVTTTFSIAAVIGPALGGTFGELDWWRGAFWATTPFTLAFVWIAWRKVPLGERGGLLRIPFRRLFLLAAAVVAIGLASQWDGPAIKWSLLIGGVALIWLAIRIDGSSERRIFPSRVLSLNATIGSAFWVQGLIFVTVANLHMFMPLVLNTLYGVTPLKIGLANMVFSFAWTAGAIIVANRPPAGQRRGMNAGMAIAAVACIALAATVGVISPLAVGALFTLAGIGIGMTITTATDWTLTRARPGEEVVTATSLPMMRALGIVFGSGLAAVLANGAGLGDGVTPEAVARAVTWIWGLTVVAPLAALYAVLRMQTLNRREGGD